MDEDLLIQAGFFTTVAVPTIILLFMVLFKK